MEDVAATQRFVLLKPCSFKKAVDPCANHIASKIEKITNILQSRQYNISSTPTRDLSIEVIDNLDNYNLTIQNGLHIFRPTAGVLSDFENFLQKVEDIAGRKAGVVKVIVPKEL